MGEVNGDEARAWPSLERAIEEAGRGGWRPWQRIASARSRRASGDFPPGIYIFTFHSVIRREDAQTWERAYDKVAVTVDAFRATLDFLSAQFAPLTLSDALAFVDRDVDRPYGVLTFDDGYTNTLTQAAPVVAEFGYTPALFVNAAFAKGDVYYRVLAAMLTRDGHASVLAEELRKRVPSVPWSSDPERLFDQTKDAYVRGAVEEGTAAAFRRVFGDPSSLCVHLTPEQVRSLVGRGWQVGNHTYGHDVLNDLTADAVADTLERNERYWKSEGVTMLPCIAFPNGAARHVGRGVVEYLDRRRELHGMFCNGGVNVRARRTEWLRIPVTWSGAESMPAVMRDQVARMRRAARLMERAAS